MNENFGTLLNFIFDSTKSWSIRAARVIVIITFAFLADLIFSFSYYYQNGKKLEQIERIFTLRESYKSYPNKVKELNRIETEIFSKEHYTEFVNRNIRNLSNNSTNDNTNKVEKRELLWMILSSNTFLVILLPILFGVIIFSGKKDKTFNMIIGFFASVIMILTLIVVVTWISYQIPLHHNPKLSYILNFILQFLFLFLIFYVSTRKNKSSIVDNQ